MPQVNLKIKKATGTKTGKRKTAKHSKGEEETPDVKRREAKRRRSEAEIR